MFKNKHMTTAMIVAPMLAIISYFATDYLISDLPVAAERGQAYPLLAKSNCRYQSGQCTLRNGDLEVDLRIENLDNGQKVLLARSSHPLKGAKAALTSASQNGVQTETQPQSFQATDGSQEQWQLPLGDGAEESTELQIAMIADSTTFFASTETTFFKYDTVFPRNDW